jgi:hypothetical protein
MGLYTVDQDTYAFDLYRKGTSMILNPSELNVTIADTPHDGDDYGYSKGRYSNYELADIQINGSYEGGTERPFMFYLKEFLDNNNRHHVKPVIERNMTYDRSERGWWVDWDGISEELQPLCEQILAQDVSPMLTPITEDSQSKKTRAGYGNMTLYASGQLFQAVRVEVI